MASVPTPAARRRRDAVRNSERIVAAAREVVAEEGLDARMKAIADRAGVGVGTVYRSIGSRQALLELVLGEAVERSVLAVRAALEEKDAGAAFRGWLLGAAVPDLDNRAISVILAARDPDAPIPGAEELERALSGLLRRAQDAGAVRDDVAVTDVFLLFATLTRVANATARVGDGGYAARLAALQLEALRPGGAQLPGAPLSLDELERTLELLARR